MAMNMAMTNPSFSLRPKALNGHSAAVKVARPVR
jgi:hypothetical protein